MYVFIFETNYIIYYVVVYRQFTFKNDYLLSVFTTTCEKKIHNKRSCTQMDIIILWSPLIFNIIDCKMLVESLLRPIHWVIRYKNRFFDLRLSSLQGSIKLIFFICIFLLYLQVIGKNIFYFNPSDIVDIVYYVGKLSIDMLFKLIHWVWILSKSNAFRFKNNIYLFFQ